VVREIDPACYVVRWRHALYLFGPPQRMLGVFQTKAEQEIPQDRPFGLAVKAFEVWRLCKLLGNAFDGDGAFAFLRCARTPAEGFKKLPSTSAETEAEHVEDGGKNRREIEILHGDRQGLFVVARPDFTGHTAAEHFIDDRSGSSGAPGFTRVLAP